MTKKYIKGRRCICVTPFGVCLGMQSMNAVEARRWGLLCGGVWRRAAREIRCDIRRSSGGSPRYDVLESCYKLRYNAICGHKVLFVHDFASISQLNTK